MPALPSCSLPPILKRSQNNGKFAWWGVLVDQNWVARVHFQKTHSRTHSRTKGIFPACFVQVGGGDATLDFRGCSTNLAHLKGALAILSTCTAGSTGSRRPTRPEAVRVAVLLSLTHSHHRSRQGKSSAKQRDSYLQAVVPLAEPHGLYGTFRGSNRFLQRSKDEFCVRTVSFVSHLDGSQNPQSRVAACCATHVRQRFSHNPNRHLAWLVSICASTSNA